MNQQNEGRIILAADKLSLTRCLELMPLIGPRLYAVKVHNHYDLHGPDVVADLKEAGAARVWVDAKLHDIPHTVWLRLAVYAAAGADIVSVHASGGVEMMKAAVDVGLQVYAITVLTSLSATQVSGLFCSTPQNAAGRLAHWAREAGVHGLVCSPQEVAALRSYGLDLVVPGVRSPGVDAGDQQRTGTPAGAVAAGAARLVVGRQITEAEDPVAALDQIEAELAEISEDED